MSNNKEIKKPIKTFVSSHRQHPFTSISNVILTCPEISSKAFRVYCYLCSKVNMQWEFYNNEMAKNMDFSEWTLKGVLKELEDLNLIQRIFHKDANARYAKREIIVRLEVTKEELEEFIKLKNKNSKNLQSLDIVESTPLVENPPVVLPPVENPPTNKRKKKEIKNKENNSFFDNKKPKEINLEDVKNEVEGMKDLIKELGFDYKKFNTVKFYLNLKENITNKPEMTFKNVRLLFNQYLRNEISYDKKTPSTHSPASPRLPKHDLKTRITPMISGSFEVKLNPDRSVNDWNLDERLAGNIYYYENENFLQNWSQTVPRLEKDFGIQFKPKENKS